MNTDDYTRPSLRLATSALKFAGKGKTGFPCKLDKAPHTPRGFKDATTDPARVTAFWTRYPDANIGIPTGKASGLFIVDMDTYKSGANQPPGWIGRTLWTYDLYPKLQNPAREIRTAIDRLGGETYLRSCLQRARGAVA